MIQRLGRLPGQPPRIIDHGPAYGSERARAFVSGVMAVPDAPESGWRICRACGGEFLPLGNARYCSRKCIAVALAR